jgi:hypothetical protein
VPPPLAATNASGRLAGNGAVPGPRPRLGSQQLPASTLRLRQRPPQPRTGMFGAGPPPLPNGAGVPGSGPAPIGRLPPEQNRPSGINRLAALLKGAQAGRQPPSEPATPQNGGPAWTASLTATLAAANGTGAASPLTSLPPLPLRSSLASISAPKGPPASPPDLSSLPPAIARSLARLGTVTLPKADPGAPAAGSEPEGPLTDLPDGGGEHRDR